MPCSASDTTNLFGQYTYEEYSFEWPTGRSTSFKELGASGATLEISCDMSITLTMHMLNGTEHLSRAQILELYLKGDTGHLIAKWPEMAYAVRKDFTLHGNTLRYVIRFNEPFDAFRYGGVDRGLLRQNYAAPACMGKTIASDSPVTNLPLLTGRTPKKRTQ